MIVVYGASSSGKSNIAENIAVSLAGKSKRHKLYYIATMEKESRTAAIRIARHRKLREGKGFITIEEELDMNKITVARGSVILLECVSNLVANVLFNRYKIQPIPDSEVDAISYEIAESIVELSRDNELIVVTNNVFNNYYYADKWCDGYMKVLGRVNEILAEKGENFIEVTAGIENVLKGENYW